MTVSRREFLQAGLAVGVGATAGFAQTRPLLGLIAPPAGYPVPAEGLALYDSTIRFTVVALGAWLISSPATFGYMDPAQVGEGVLPRRAMVRAHRKRIDIEDRRFTLIRYAVAIKVGAVAARDVFIIRNEVAVAVAGRGEADAEVKDYIERTIIDLRVSQAGSAAALLSTSACVMSGVASCQTRPVRPPLR